MCSSGGYFGSICSPESVSPGEGYFIVGTCGDIESLLDESARITVPGCMCWTNKYIFNSEADAPAAEATP